MDERSLRRFMRKVEVLPNGCWHWTGRLTGNGYGTFSFGSKRYQAHRAAYEHFVEQVPDGLDLDHVCHSDDLECPGGVSCPHRNCVNWRHLEPCTRKVNNNRGRGPSARHAGKTHCDHGHEFTEANTYITPAGYRQCRTCRARIMRQVADRRIKGPKPPPTRCPQGHKYEGDNLAFTKRGTRRCRACARARFHAAKARKREGA